MSKNYFSYAKMTTEEFFNTTVKNAIDRAKENNENYAHIVIWNMTVGHYALKMFLKAMGMEMKPAGFRSHSSYNIYF